MAEHPNAERIRRAFDAFARDVAELPEKPKDPPSKGFLGRLTGR